MTYADAEEFLFGLPRFAVSGTDAYKPGMERIEKLLHSMGQPQHSFESILVAGTNGKGSTASMISAIASAGGYKTGLHTSPHLQFFGERMRINGIPAGRDWILDATSRFQDAIQNVNASFFEASVALSFLYFAENHVDLAVVEVGLGGRLDATNILEPELSIITNIALDHTHILGPTLPEIAAEKGGIMRAGKPTLVGTTNPAVNMVLGDMADDIGSEFHMLSAEIDIDNRPDGKMFIETMRERYGPVEIPLDGEHHVVHASLAIRAAELVSKKYPLMRAAAVNGIASLAALSGLRGRMEEISHDPPIWLDVAHNPQAIGAALRLRTTGTQLSNVIIGLMEDKDAREIGRLLAQTGLPVSVVGMDQSRGSDPNDLAASLIDCGVEIAAVYPAVETALAEWVSEHSGENWAGDSIADCGVLILGSHIIVGDALNWWAKFKSTSVNPG